MGAFGGRRSRITGTSKPITLCGWLILLNSFVKVIFIGITVYLERGILNDWEYYNNWLLDGVERYQLTGEERALLDACILMVDNGYSIRDVESNTGYPKSTFHKHIHTKLRKLSYELYSVVVKLLEKNKQTAAKKSWVNRRFKKG